MSHPAPLPWVLVAALTVAATAHAEDTTDLQSLLSERVVTTASTTAERESTAPALSTTITAEDLHRFGIRTLAEALTFLSLGVVAGDTLRTPDIGARGVLFENDSGKHFLLMVNGHAVNDPLYGAARFDQGAGVPFDLIDHIEVVLGPGSVLYGSNAMMGVINVITKSGGAYRGGHALGEYEFGRSAHVAAGGGTTFELFGAPSELTLAADYYRQTGPELTFDTMRTPGDFFGSPFRVSFGPTEPGVNVWGGTVTHAYFAEAPSAMLRLRSGDFELNLMGSAYRRGIPYATSSLPVEFDDGSSEEVDRALRLDARHEATLSALVQLTSRLYADTYDYQRHLDVPAQLCLAPSPCRYYDAGLSRWAGIEERVSLNWLHDQSLVTLLGIDMRERWASAKEDLTDEATGAYLAPTAGHIDVRSTLIAPYLQQTYSPTRWLDLNAGARLDADSRFSPVLSPRGAVALHPWEKTTFKGIYSQAFRAPTWSETLLANHLVAPSDGVQPETVRSLEGSIEQRFGTNRLLLSLFRTWWDHLIESTNLTAAEKTELQSERKVPPFVANIEQFRNLSTLDNYGLSLAWEGSAGATRVRYGVNVTEALSLVDDPSGAGTLVAAPRYFGNAHLIWAMPGYVPTPGLVAAVLGPRPMDRPAADGSTLPPAPPLADLRLTLTGSLPLRGLSYRASAEYVTASHGPYSAGPDLTWLTVGGRTIEGMPTPVAAPVDQLRAFVGLRYDFATGEGAAE
jgi:outer membrane receptor for ferrienterochelin and colicins